MPSFIWDRDPQEAMDNPYEYEAQEQFVREAESILNLFSNELGKFDMKFTVDDRSLEKAIWMLQNDALDSLKDILESLAKKRHRVAGKLFRDIIETLDLAAFFHSNTKESNKNLTKWFDDEIIPHSVHRDYIKKELGDEYAIASRDYYRTISKFTHRTFKILLYGYVLGRNELIAYDGYKDSDILVLPQTIAMYYAIQADFIKFFSYEVYKRGLVPYSRVEEIWEECLEKDSVPRRFITPKEIFERYKKNKNSSQ